MQSIQPDSLKVRINDSAASPEVETMSVSVSRQSDSSHSGDSHTVVLRKTEPKVKVISLAKDTSLTDSIQVPVANVAQAQNDTIPEIFSLFSSLQKSDSAVLITDKSVIGLSYPQLSHINYTGAELRNAHGMVQKFWTFGVGLTLVFSFIFFRIYYQKYITGVMASALNIQMAEKLMREKNVIIRRVFLFLNLNFVIGLALFAYVLLQYFGIKIGTSGSFVTYIHLFLILVAFLILRYGLIQLIGALFDSTLIFKEYLHNTYLINKNLGLYLLPLAISVFYLRQPFADIAFFTAGVLLVISLVYKYFRAVQILMKHKVFLFYSILYFCTLEILPVLAGVKYVLSLR